MFGKLNLEEFTGLTSMPQRAASAWSGFESAGLVGASYKPLLFYATQLVKGVNYYFIAEQTLTTHPIIRRVVKLVINEFEKFSHKFLTFMELLFSTRKRLDDFF